MKDRELLGWLSAVTATVAALIAVGLLVFAPPTHTRVVHLNAPAKVTIIREKVTLTSVLKFLSNQPVLGIQDLQTPYGRAACTSFPPLIDGRTLIVDCTLYTPVAPFSGPKNGK